MLLHSSSSSSLSSIIRITIVIIVILLHQISSSSSFFSVLALEIEWPTASDLPLQPDETNTITLSNIEASTAWRLTDLFPKENINVHVKDSFIDNVIWPTDPNFYLKNMTLSFTNSQVRIIGFSFRFSEFFDGDDYPERFPNRTNSITLLENAKIEFHRCLVTPKLGNVATPNPLSKMQALQLSLTPQSRGWSFLFNRSIYRLVTDNSFMFQNIGVFSNWRADPPIGIIIDWDPGSVSETVPNNLFQFEKVEVIDSTFTSNNGLVQFFAFEMARLYGHWLRYYEWEKRILVRGHSINISGNTATITTHDGYDIEKNNASQVRNAVAVFGPGLQQHLELSSHMTLDDNKVDIRNSYIIGSLSIFYNGYNTEAALVVGLEYSGKVLVAYIRDVPLISVSRNKIEAYAMLYPDISEWPKFYAARFEGFGNITSFEVSENHLSTTLFGVRGFDTWFYGEESPLLSPSNYYNTNDTAPNRNLASSSQIGAKEMIFNNNYIVASDFNDFRGIGIGIRRYTQGCDLFLVENNTFSTRTDIRGENITQYRRLREKRNPGSTDNFRLGGAIGFEMTRSGSKFNIMKDIRNLTFAHNTFAMFGSYQATAIGIYNNMWDVHHIAIVKNNFTVHQFAESKPFAIEDVTNIVGSPYVHGIRQTIYPLRIYSFLVADNNINISTTGCTDFTSINLGNFLSDENVNYSVPLDDLPAIARQHPERLFFNLTITRNKMHMTKIQADSIEATGGGIRTDCLGGCNDLGSIYIHDNSLTVDSNGKAPAAGFGCIGASFTQFGYGTEAFIIRNNYCKASFKGLILAGVNIQVSSNIDIQKATTAFRVEFRSAIVRNFRHLDISNNEFDLANEGGTATTLSFVGAGSTHIQHLTMSNNIAKLKRTFPVVGEADIESIRNNALDANVVSHISMSAPYGKATINGLPISSESGFDVALSSALIENETIISSSTGASLLSSRCGFFSDKELIFRNISIKSNAGSLVLSADEKKQATAIIHYASVEDATDDNFRWIQQQQQSSHPRLNNIVIINSVFESKIAHCDDIILQQAAVGVVPQREVNKKMSFVNILPGSKNNERNIVGNISLVNVSFTQDCTPTYFGDDRNNNNNRSPPQQIEVTNSIINLPFLSSSHSSFINVTRLKINSLPSASSFSQENNNAIFGDSTNFDNSGGQPAAKTSILVACTEWNDRFLSQRSFASKSAFLYAANADLPSCNGADYSSTLTFDLTPSATILQSMSRSNSKNTQSLSYLPEIEDVGDDAIETAVGVAQAAAIISNFASANPSLVLSVARGAVLARLGACHVNRKDLTPAQLAYKYQNDTEKMLSKRLSFPLALFPGLKLGSNPAGQYYRGSLLIFILLFVVAFLVTALLGTVNKATWKKLRLSNNNNISFGNKRRNSSSTGEQEEETITTLETLMAKTTANKSKKKSKNTSSNDYDSDDDNQSIFRHVAIDRFMLLPLVFVLPFWGEVSGGLIHGRPSGAGDGVFAMLPLSFIIFIFLFFSRRLYRFVSLSKTKTLKTTSPSKKKERQGHRHHHHHRHHRDRNESERELEEEEQDESTALIPLNHMEPSDIYSAKTATQSYQQKMKQFLRTKIGKFTVCGSICWNNPTQVYQNEIQQIACVPMPSMFTQFALIFDTYRGPEKIIEREKEEESHQTRSSQRRSSNQHRHNHHHNHHHQERQDKNRNDSSPSSSRVMFSVGASLIRMNTSPTSNITPNSSSSAYYHKQNSSSSNDFFAFPSSPPQQNSSSGNRNLNDNCSSSSAIPNYYEKIQYDFSTRRKLQVIWLPFTILLTLIVCCVGGAGTVDKTKCHDFFFVVLALCVINMMMIAWLKPYIVPLKTSVTFAIDFLTVIGGVMLLSAVISDENAKDLDSVVSAGQWLCTLPGTILGVFCLLSGGTKAICLRIGKNAIAPISLLRSRIRSELQELEEELLPSNVFLNSSRRRSTDAANHHHGIGDSPAEMTLLDSPTSKKRSNNNKDRGFGTSLSSAANNSYDRQKASSSSKRKNDTSNSRNSDRDPRSSRSSPRQQVQQSSRGSRFTAMALADDLESIVSDVPAPPSRQKNKSRNASSSAAFREPKGTLRGLF